MRIGCNRAPAPASASASGARPLLLGAWRARVGACRPAPSSALLLLSAPPRRRPASAAPPRASTGPGGLPPDATVEDLLAALGTLSSGSDSDSDFGGNASSNERVILPCGTVDYYALLQVDDDATPQAIKRAYRGLARECHPDYRCVRFRALSSLGALPGRLPAPTD